MLDKAYTAGVKLAAAEAGLIKISDDDMSWDAYVNNILFGPILPGFMGLVYAPSGRLASGFGGSLVGAAAGRLGGSALAEGLGLLSKKTSKLAPLITYLGTGLGSALGYRTAVY